MLGQFSHAHFLVEVVFRYHVVALLSAEDLLADVQDVSHISSLFIICLAGEQHQGLLVDVERAANTVFYQLGQLFLGVGLEDDVPDQGEVQL